MNDEILGMAEIADRTGINVDTLYVMKSRGQLPPPDGTVGAGRTLWWKASTIDAWNRSRRSKT